ncbi:MAG: diacylglycerol/polyprenol kinase family protein [Methanobacterium sp.]|uniref:diacylglycerol/polyprenol kinase family protein n=1 Tax=Methanobacterium sp. TaxID=2164 RepID=UPI003C743165
MDREILRQIIHASGIFILVLGIFLNPQVLILLCIIILVLSEMVFILDKYYHIPFFSDILTNCKRHDDERGFLYFFIGIIGTLYIFRFNMAIADAGILMLILGDSASTIIGTRYGKHKLPFKSLKSFEGSLAFFFVSFLSALTLLPLVPVLFGALVGTITEAYSPIDDNIPVPIISALAITVVIYWL